MQLNQYKLQSEIGKVGPGQEAGAGRPGQEAGAGGAAEHPSFPLMGLGSRARTPQPDWAIKRRAEIASGS